MIDTHVHLDDKQFNGDREAVIERAFQSGVEKMINIGAGLGSSQRSVEMAKMNENIYAAVGFHPHYFNEYKESSLDKIGELEKLAEERKVVAIGEIGLDYFSHQEFSITDEEKEYQKKGFIRQLEIAKSINLPVVVHCRDAYEEVLEIISKYPELAYTFHCYAGDVAFTEKLLEMKNVYFSFTGNITYAKPKAEIIRVIKLIPLERIMIETDCPYLAPDTERGKRNEPSFLKYVAEKVAEYKGVNLKKFLEVAKSNSEKFFKILKN